MKKVLKYILKQKLDLIKQILRVKNGVVWPK